MHVGPNQLARIYKFKYLGVVLDPELSFDQALNAAISKFSMKLHTLSVIRPDINRACAVRMVKAMLLLLLTMLAFYI